MPRMRTIAEAAAHFKTVDPDTCLNPFRIRQMVLQGEIRAVMAGRKYLVNLDELEAYLSNPVAMQPAPMSGGIRPICVGR